MIGKSGLKNPEPILAKWRSYILETLEQAGKPLEVSAFTHPYIGQGVEVWSGIIFCLAELSALGEVWHVPEPGTSDPELSIFGLPSMTKFEPEQFWEVLQNG